MAIISPDTSVLKASTNAWTNGYWTSNTKVATKHTLSGSVDVTHVAVYIHSYSSTSGSIRVAVYGDNGSGAPGALLGQSNSVLVSSLEKNRWIEIPLTGTLNLAAGSYYPTVHNESSNLYMGLSGSTATVTRWTNTDTYSDGPANPYNSATTSTAGAPAIALADGTGFNLEVPKVVGYAVLAPSTTGVSVSKVVGYAIISHVPGVQVSKALRNLVAGPPSGVSVAKALRNVVVQAPVISSVTFDGMPATGVVEINDNEVEVTVPAGVAAGPVDVAVLVDGVTVTETDGYTYDEVRVDSIDPTTGPAFGGTPITITGAGYTSGATVTVGGVAATNVVVVNSTTITCTTPRVAPGDRTVVVVSQGSTSTGAVAFASSDDFTVTPDHGTASGGTRITIRKYGIGGGFITAPINRLTVAVNATTFLTGRVGDYRPGPHVLFEICTDWYPDYDGASFTEVLYPESIPFFNDTSAEGFATGQMPNAACDTGDQWIYIHAAIDTTVDSVIGVASDTSRTTLSGIPHFTAVSRVGNILTATGKNLTKLDPAALVYLYYYPSSWGTGSQHLTCTMVIDSDTQATITLPRNLTGTEMSHGLFCNVSETAPGLNFVPNISEYNYPGYVTIYWPEHGDGV